jgi:hypothetical protein
MSDVRIPHCKAEKVAAGETKTTALEETVDVVVKTVDELSVTTATIADALYGALPGLPASSCGTLP